MLYFYATVFGSQLAKPIMKKHSWYLPRLAEFFPSQTNLLGINCNGGQKICLRLRPAHSPSTFYDEEHLIGTMLHELTHNVRGPHDQIFYKQLDALQDEYDALRASGYSGEGFLGNGNRVGLGVSHDLPPDQARKLALMKLEEKERVRRLLGTGGKLGGEKPDTRGKRIGDILADVSICTSFLYVPSADALLFVGFSYRLLNGVYEIRRVAVVASPTIMLQVPSKKTYPPAFKKRSN